MNTLILLAGLPGSGKTTIADALAERLNWKVVHVDEFKRELMKKDPNANFLKEIVPASYQEVMRKLIERKESELVVEELCNDRKFVEDVQDFCKKNGIGCRWFKIIRDKETILHINVHNTRERTVVNSPEIIDMLERQLEEIKIDGEVDIYNRTIDQSVDEILSKLEHPTF